MHDAIKEKLTHLMNEFLLHGGFPRVIRSSNVEEKQEVLKNLAYTFMMRDIKEILNIQNEYKFDKLLKALSFQIGNIISYNELSKVTELSFKTLKSYLNTLEKTYIIKLISPFYKNKRTELVKSPKVYFVDTGLRNSISSNFLLPSQRGDKGALGENIIFSELLKAGITPNFWRSKSDAEVDFVWERETELIAIEAKSRLKKPELPPSLKTFIDKYKPDTVFVFNEALIERKRNIIYMPYFMLPIVAERLQSSVPVI
jgi:predicted AAA+ superfamily ATPase